MSRLEIWILGLAMGGAAALTYVSYNCRNLAGTAHYYCQFPQWLF